MIVWYVKRVSSSKSSEHMVWLCLQNLHLYAVEKTLSGLEPPIKPKRFSIYSDDQSLRVWLNKVREVSNAIESTLMLSSQHPIAHRARCD